MEPRQVPYNPEKTAQLEVQLTPPVPSFPFYPPVSPTAGVESRSPELPYPSIIEPWPPEPPDI
ncbi:MAG: hypothetical protein M1830_006784 [Pleopsidium flavum]|nr:MAG: hypothetical protein M1830_006784 [Pleopsidium flavum]